MPDVKTTEGAKSQWQSWLRLGCGYLLFFAVVGAIGAFIFFGFRIYISVSDDIARLELQVGRLQDQFDRALDTNDEALETYRELVDKAEAVLEEADEIPTDLRNFRLELARLATETQKLNDELRGARKDVQTLRNQINGESDEIEDLRGTIDNVAEPTSTPSPMPASTPSPTPTPSPTAEPTAAPSPTPTPSPTAASSPMPASTPSPTLTPSPTAEPTAVPSPTPTSTPSPTAEPTAAPSPTPTSTPTPTPVPNLDVSSSINWVIGDMVDKDVEANIKEGIRLVFEYLASLGMPDPEESITVYIYHDKDAMVDAYAEIYGNTPSDYRDLRFGRAAPRNLVPGSYVFIETQHLWRIFAGDQAALALWSLNGVLTAHLTNLQLSVTPDGVTDTGPVWLNEGIATFLTLQGFDKAGVLSYEFIRSSSTRHVRTARTLYTLKDLTTFDDFKRFGLYGFTFALLAAELLAERTSQASLLDYYTTWNSEIVWQQQFETVFGIGIDEFYDEFVTFARTEFPDFDNWDEDFPDTDTWEYW